MFDFFANLIALVAQIWVTDEEVRDRSVFGESEFERNGRLFVARLCGGIIIGVAVAAVAWRWFTRKS